MKKIVYACLLSFILILGACTQENDEKQKKDEEQVTTEKQNDSNHEDEEAQDHSMMKHSSSGKIPEDLQEAKEPKYSIGSKAMIETDHMKGMKGAEATIVGAFDTTAYVISYTPTNGGERVKDHKWVVQEEIKDAGEKTLSSGDEATIEADHMKGMKGAKATIESSEKTTVYMIDYTPTTGGKEVKNHKWVTEEELSKE